MTARRVIDLTEPGAALAAAAAGWVATGGPLPDELAGVRTPEQLAHLSAARPKGIDDVVWDALVWRLATESEAAVREELAELARTDPLTGLLNRRGLAEALEREVARARRGGGTVCVVLLDLDRFKDLNDSLGHAAGDVALVQVADILRRGLRGGDVAGRWGGDEFGIVFVDLEERKAYDVVDRLRATLVHPSSGMGRGRRVTFSAGVAALTGPDTTAEALMTAADAALYAAKADGGNRARRSRPA